MNSEQDAGKAPKHVESVWDYPRPPRLEASAEHVVVEAGGRVVADTRNALRVLETSHPPVYYIPPDDIRDDVLAPSAGSSWCEFKGRAAYMALVSADGRRREQAGWLYPEPSPPYAALRDHVAFYPGRVERCTVDGEVVRGQEGDFYGGWITDRIRGPFKGGPGTDFW